MTAKHATELEDALWRDAYYIAWVGACNKVAVENTLIKFREYGFTNDHGAMVAIQGHLDFLNHIGLGPNNLETVLREGTRLGLHHS